ncbi:MAG TPA: hypothetical protein VIT83_03665, partial [Gammaproteobacteria bacterium]
MTQNKLTAALLVALSMSACDVQYTKSTGPKPAAERESVSTGASKQEGDARSGTEQPDGTIASPLSHPVGGTPAPAIFPAANEPSAGAIVRHQASGAGGRLRADRLSASQVIAEQNEQAKS